MSKNIPVGLHINPDHNIHIRTSRLEIWMASWMRAVIRDDKIKNTRDNKSVSGFRKDHRRTNKQVRACGQQRRTHTEERVDDEFTRKREERMTENKMERHVPT